LYRILAPAAANPESWPFFGNPAKSGSGLFLFRIPVQLQYVQLIMDKTNAADMPSGVFTILITVNWMKKKFIAFPHISSKTGKQ